MSITELIESLEALKSLHGEVDVTVLQYDGGADCLCDVKPKFNEELRVVEFETFYRN